VSSFAVIRVNSTAHRLTSSCFILFSVLEAHVGVKENKAVSSTQAKVIVKDRTFLFLFTLKCYFL
jgi:hypothetical protein